jgi:DNA polymerase III sliding clamp (beta) subunit (PCNA family)
MSKIALPINELKALIGPGKIIAKRSTLPVLNHLKIERTKDGWIALTATDLDHFTTMRLEQPTAGEPLAVLIPYEELQKITKTCQKTDSILIGSEENASEGSVVIQYAIGNQVVEAKVESLPPAEFPEIPRIKGKPVPIDGALRQSIHEALECASSDESRLILDGAYVDTTKSDAHHVVAPTAAICSAAIRSASPSRNR